MATDMKEGARFDRVSDKLKKLKGKKKAKEERKAATSRSGYVAKEGRKAPGKGMAASIEKKIARKEKKLTKLTPESTRSFTTRARISPETADREGGTPYLDTDATKVYPSTPLEGEMPDRPGHLARLRGQSSTDMARSAAKKALEPNYAQSPLEPEYLYPESPRSVTVDPIGSEGGTPGYKSFLEELTGEGAAEPEEEEGFDPTSSSPTEEGAEAEGDEYEDKSILEKTALLRGAAAGARGIGAGARAAGRGAIAAEQTLSDLNKNIVGWLDDLW